MLLRTILDATCIDTSDSAVEKDFIVLNVAYVLTGGASCILHPASEDNYEI